MDKPRKRTLITGSLLAVFLVAVLLITAHGRHQKNVEESRWQLKEGSGWEQAKAIQENQPFICERINIGDDCQAIKQVLGPPLNSDEDIIWFYPRWTGAEAMMPAEYFFVVKDGKVASDMCKTVATDFKQDFSPRMRGETEYRRIVDLSEKYIGQRIRWLREHGKE